VVSTEGLEVITVSLDGLSHHVLSVNIIVSVLDGGLEVSLSRSLMLLSNLFLNELKLISIESAVGNKVTEELDCLLDVTLEDLKAELRIFSVGLAVVAATHVLNGLCNLALVAAGGSTEEHLLEEVG
jgi:hypothetical protein